MKNTGFLLLSSLSRLARLTNPGLVSSAPALQAHGIYLFLFHERAVIRDKTFVNREKTRRD